MNDTITLIVNGRKTAVITDPQRPLLDVLREDLKLTGTKYGCGRGQCGACTVLIEGKRSLSCITSVSEASNKEIITIEGLTEGGRMHPVQEAFLEEGAIQCGYCTPGMVLSAVSLLKKIPTPAESEIIEWMNPNLCRCCDYIRIVKAVQRVAKGASEVKSS